MKDRTAEPRQGDRGQWYLKMLGIESESGPTTLQEVARERNAGRTAELVTDMWDQTAEIAPTPDVTDPLADWEPAGLSSKASSQRRVRWPVIALALVVGIGAAFALWWIPQASEQRAANHADVMRDSLSGLAGDLAGLQQALAVATDPATEVPDLGTISSALSSVADSSARLLDVANQPVPSPLPLAAREPFDDLDGFRVGLEPLAAEATALRSDVAEIADYRLALAEVLSVGELPLTADSAVIAEQTAALAKVLADSVAALNSMDTEGPFGPHRQLVDREVTGFAQWQDDYLAALRNGNPTAAGELVEQLRLSRDGLAAELIGPLATLRSAIDGRILELWDRLNQAIAAVP